MRIQAKANSFDLKETKAPIIHGETNIVLKNVKTGLVERIHSENTFQSAKIAQFMRSLGQNAISQFDVEQTPYLWQNVVGGIFLFRDAIPVGSSYMPAGNKMVGNGSYGIANNSDTTEMGSYSSQSSATGSAITQIYEYMTNQANGEIGSVCLTSALGGYIGYGNASGHSLASKRGINSITYAPNRSATPDGIQYGPYEYTNQGISSQQILQITKRKRGMLTASVFDGFTETLTFDLTQIGNHYSASSCSIIFYYVGSGKFRGIPKIDATNSVEPGGSIYYYEFDATTDTLTENSFLNSTGKTLYLGSLYQNWYFSGFGGDYFYAYDLATNKREIIKLSTGAHVAELNLTRTASGFYGVPLVPDLYQFGNNDGNIYLFDAVNLTCYPCNMNTYVFGYIENNDTMQDPSHMQTNSSSNSNRPFNNPLYLATINNLGSPVTKTAAQTMKVVYTLTEV